MTIASAAPPPGVAPPRTDSNLNPNAKSFEAPVKKLPAYAANWGSPPTRSENEPERAEPNADRAGLKFNWEGGKDNVIARRNDRKPVRGRYEAVSF